MGNIHSYFKITSFMFVLLILVSCSQKMDQDYFDSLVNAMQESSIRLETNEPTINTTAFAYTPEENRFYLGITFKENQVPSSQQQKAMYEKFLSEAAGATSITNWKEALQTYNVTFEQLLPDNKRKTLAVKQENSQIIEIKN
ncbi:hypothetical protein [Paenibacillus sp. Marseille-Q4541]|uniref:hypothetical protein n=1 Tax=Paenibacillus sp. Marseille-Q4541 TaxID=2831522 RepID=UPI001BAA0C21|nr:hypothetical protein [Paenibacillus sp. Marseille-Q4541]